MYTDVLAGINSIKSSLNSISGDYIYTPGDTILFSGANNISGSNYGKMGEFTPKYNGYVYFYNTTTSTTNYGALIPVNLADVAIPYMQGNYLEARAEEILKGINISNTNHLTYYAPSVNRNQSVKIPVWAGIPIFVYGQNGQGIYNWQFRGNVTKI